MTVQVLGFLSSHRVLTFFLATYLLTWAFWLPQVVTGRASELLRMVGGFGPTLSALGLTWPWSGKEGLRRLLQPMLIWRVNVLWYLFSFFGTAVAVLAAIGLHVALGGAAPEFNDPGQLYLVLVHLFHAASNTTFFVLPILPMDTGGDLRPLWLGVALLWLFTLGVIAVAGPSCLSRKPKVAIQDPKTSRRVV